MADIKTWTEIDPIYLTDFKKRPIEMLFFFNRVRINTAAKTPTLRRRSGMQMVTVDKKSEIEDAVVAFVTAPKARLLAEGLSANDYRRLPREVRNPASDIIRGTAKIYEDFDD